MPYINPTDRPKLDAMMDPIIDHIRSLPTEQQDAMLDYILTRMLRSLYQPPYFNLNRAVGVLTTTLLEFYRTVMGPYEEEKKDENGDVMPRQARRAR